MTKVHAFYDAAADAAKDPFLGLHLAMQWPRGGFGLVEFCCRSAPTVGNALARIVRYMGLLNELVVLAMDAEGPVVVVDHRIPGEPACVGRHGNEFFLTLLVSHTQLLAGRECRPRRAWFAHPAPADTSELIPVFGPQLEFDRGSNGLALDRAILDLPLATADGPLLSVLDAQAERSLDHAERPEDFGGAVRSAIRRALDGGAPSVKVVARGLGLSVRSLQRRLEAEGTTFQDEVETVRRELARTYVQSSKVPLGEIAFRLGYADTTAFLKAFKRWTGTTPSRLRRG